MASTHRGAVARVALAIGLAFAASAYAGTPYPHARTPAAQDAGALDLMRGSAPITVTVALKLRDADRLQALAAAIHTPGDPHAPVPDARRIPGPLRTRAELTVDAAVAHFKRAGLATVEYDNLVQVTRSTEAIQQAFNVKLHAFDVAAHNGHAGYRFHAPTGAPSVSSAAVAASVDSIMGLDDRPRFRPRMLKSPASRPHAAASLRQNTAPGNDPGFWTVTDLAAYYNIQPLYDQGRSRRRAPPSALSRWRRSRQSDAFVCWTGLGLPVKANRRKIVGIDGGPGVVEQANQRSEGTTPDVQQSGGVAPAAKMIVYQAPNTDQGFYDAFARAISDNAAETVSVGWGGGSGSTRRRRSTPGPPAAACRRCRRSTRCSCAPPCKASRSSPRRATTAPTTSKGTRRSPTSRASSPSTRRPHPAGSRPRAGRRWPATSRSIFPTARPSPSTCRPSGAGAGTT